MYLFVLILDRTSDLQKIIEKFSEIGITGATVYDSLGIGRSTLCNTEMPIIASLRRIFEMREKTYNHTLMSIIKTKETLDDAFRIAEEICGDFGRPDIGIMYSIELDRVIGFATPDIAEKC
ncbi:MAG: hypothetical protein ABIC40_09135 [bacterium]